MRYRYGFIALVVGVTVIQAVSQANDHTSGKVVADPERVYAGYYNIGGISDGYDEIVDKSAGNAPAIVFTFHDWNRAGVEAIDPVLNSFHDPLESNDESPLELAERISADGSVLAVAWDAIGYIVEHPEYFTGGGTQPIQWADVFAGEYDPYIRSVAQEIKQFGKPIMLSVAGEYNAIGYAGFGPEGNALITAFDSESDRKSYYGDPNIPDGPERTRDLFRHVIDIFREEDVSNVTWFMYSHTAYMNPDDLDEAERAVLDELHPRHYYPGDDYIDWIGNSAYVSADDPEQDLGFALDAVIQAYGEFTDKPFFIPEFGVTTAAGVNRSDRMRELFGEEIPGIPEIDAFAFADGELWAQFFDMPRLGHDPEELDVWQQYVWKSADYTGEVLLREIPEPQTGVIALLTLATAMISRRLI